MVWTEIFVQAVFGSQSISDDREKVLLFINNDWQGSIEKYKMVGIWFR